MTQEEDVTIGNPYDWTEFYWGGFQPSLIGAVPLIDAHSTDNDSNINKMLYITKEKLKENLKNDKYLKNNIKFQDYFVTIHDEYMNIKPSNDSNQDEKCDNDKKQKQIISVLRLWHKNVFIGVRGSGKANPGSFNFIASFDPKTAKLINFETWDSAPNKNKNK